MTHFRLFHWNAAEAKQKISILESLGCQVDYQINAPQALKELKDKKTLTDGVIIDLSRLPMQGRDIALNIRHAKATRNIPIIFVEGDREKVKQVKTQVPDANYTNYSQIQDALKKAVADPPKVTTIPRSVFEPYKDVSLAKKLGIKPDTTLALIDAPVDFTQTLGALPANVRILKQFSPESKLTMLFVETQEGLQNQLTKIVSELQPNVKLWIAWRKKKAEKIASATQTTVREAGLAAGLVDYKIASVDTTWTALLFSRRKSKKSNAYE